MQKQNSGHFLPIYQHPQWHSIVRPQLLKIASNTLNATKICQIILYFKKNVCVKRSNYKKFKHQQYNFKVLLNYHSKQVQKLFPKIASYILHMDKKLPTIEFVQANISSQYNYKKSTIIFLLCCMCFCLIPKQYFDNNIQKKRRFCWLNDFSCIFSNSQYKTKSIIEYFKMRMSQQILLYEQKVTIVRQIVKQNVEQLLKQQPKTGMSELIIQTDTVSIENYNGEIKIDFANKYIGGGSLTMGCVQEQIMFTNHPELFTTQILCEQMQDYQSLIMIGYPKYSNNSGYGYNTKWISHNDNFNEMDQQKRYKEYICAIDATKFHHNLLYQFSKQSIDREILKAYAGFSWGNKNLKIVTGNWGCGVFKGHHQLKLIIQWIAASIAHKNIIYCPYGYHKILYNEKFVKKITQNSIIQNYKNLIKMTLNIKNQKINLYQLMMQQK